MKKEKKIKTTDLYEAAYLYASNLTFLGLEKSDSRFLFVFKNKSDAKKLINSFWNKRGKVTAKEYADSIKTLKKLIYKQS